MLYERPQEQSNLYSYSIPEKFQVCRIFKRCVEAASRGKLLETNV